MGDLTNNFNAWEFECKCCKKRGIDTRVPAFLQRVRDEYKSSITVNSGYRCPAHNLKVGGKPHSTHALGIAVDVSCSATNSRLRYLLIKHAILSGITRIGIYPTFIHVDFGSDATNHPTDIMWYTE